MCGITSLQAATTSGRRKRGLLPWSVATNGEAFPSLGEAPKRSVSFDSASLAGAAWRGRLSVVRSPSPVRRFPSARLWRQGTRVARPRCTPSGWLGPSLLCACCGAALRARRDCQQDLQFRRPWSRSRSAAAEQNGNGQTSVADANTLGTGCLAIASRLQRKGA